MQLSLEAITKTILTKHISKGSWGLRGCLLGFSHRFKQMNSDQIRIHLRKSVAKTHLVQA